jgi:thiamine-phosphate pyrophosphorylase
VNRRQTVPEQWLIVETPMSAERWSALRRLRRGSGVLVLGAIALGDQRRLRYLARLRALTVVTERERAAARVHDVRELRQKLSRRMPLILLSPLHPTRSHPDWTPLPRMRAAALARLGGRQLIALGGMDSRRYAKIAPLGFIGWAGISAFRT